MSEKYPVEHFITKFEATEDDQWCTEVFNQADGKCCALGHCGATLPALNAIAEFNEEAQALIDLFAIQKRSVVYINDGIDEDYQQKTPLTRILAALRDVKEKLGKEKSNV